MVYRYNACLEVAANLLDRRGGNAGHSRIFAKYFDCDRVRKVFGRKRPAQVQSESCSFIGHAAKERRIAMKPYFIRAPAICDSLVQANSYEVHP